jgi:hypothetical protein
LGPKVKKRVDASQRKPGHKAQTFTPRKILSA